MNVPALSCPTPSTEVVSVAPAPNFISAVEVVSSFSTEAGAITASTTTQAFDVSKPDDANEGTATVTFTTDMGNGNTPMDVAPLGPVAQYPWNRGQEPSYTPFGSSLVINPRDQFVTSDLHQGPETTA